MLALLGEQVEALEQAGWLWNELGYHLKDVADYEAAAAAYRRVLAIDEAAFGPDHPKVAIRLNNLGEVHRALGEYEEAAAYRRALAIDDTAFGPDHPNVAIRLSNLGSLYQALGDTGAARQAYQRALVIRERVFPAGHPKIQLVMRKLESLPD